ncbi:MAG: hypothetical protein ACI90V_007336, partial [Bacillariaceae sp.]|jgi:hypothetical protein
VEFSDNSLARKFRCTEEVSNDTPITTKQQHNTNIPSVSIASTFTKDNTMMSLKTAISPKLQPFLQRAIQNHGGLVRPMTMMNKSSAEEYKKKVRTVQ